MTIEKYVEALGPVLAEDRQRPTKGAVGEVRIGQAYRPNNPNTPDGKATLIVRDIYVTYGIVETETWVLYDYKVGPGVKGSERQPIKRFLEMMGAV